MFIALFQGFVFPQIKTKNLEKIKTLRLAASLSVDPIEGCAK
jgi:hypothetical protein